MRILLSGGTGFIGLALLRRLLDEEHTIILLCRNPKKVQDFSSPHLHIITWDTFRDNPCHEQFENLDAIINLAGENIAAKRWSVPQKEKIRESRLQTLRNLIKLISKQENKPSVFIQASAVGYYGNISSEDVLETHSSGHDFLAQVCVDVENETKKIEQYKIRTVCLRIGVVLEKHGGALSRMLLPFQLFLGGPLGHGRQWFPWIHRDDLIHIILFVLSHSSIRGPVNAVAPDAVSMKRFCEEWGHALHRPSWIPVPAIILRILLGEMSQIVLTGQKVVPQILLDHQYAFQYPKLPQALQAILLSNATSKTNV